MNYTLQPTVEFQVSGISFNPRIIIKKDGKNSRLLLKWIVKSFHSNALTKQ